MCVHIERAACVYLFTELMGRRPLGKKRDKNRNVHDIPKWRCSAGMKKRHSHTRRQRFLHAPPAWEEVRVSRDERWIQGDFLKLSR